MIKGSSSTNLSGITDFFRGWLNSEPGKEWSFTSVLPQRSSLAA
jgi:hypothetical protein